MNPSAAERLVAYMQAYAEKDLPTLAAMLDDAVRLQDWNIAVQGREAFLRETARNFDQALSLAIEIVRTFESADGRQAAAELKIVVNGSIELSVVDVLDFDEGGQLLSVRAFKG
jgi:steroid delta-isomerase